MPPSKRHAGPSLVGASERARTTVRRGLRNRPLVKWLTCDERVFCYQTSLLDQFICRTPQCSLQGTGVFHLDRPRADGPSVRTRLGTLEIRVCGSLICHTGQHQHDIWTERARMECICLSERRRAGRPERPMHRVRRCRKRRAIAASLTGSPSISSAGLCWPLLSRSR